MIHPHTHLKIVSPEIGLGVFATKDIPLGTIVYAKDPLEIVIDEDQFDCLPELVKQKADIYSYIESNGARVLSWDSAKFVNHCCEANTLSTGYGFEIAIRDIKAGEEITDDYGMFNIPHDMKLYCNCKNCREVLRAADFNQLVPYWDEKVTHALASLRKVDQPLIDLIPPQLRKSLFEYLDSGKNYFSVAQLQLSEDQVSRPTKAPKPNGATTIESLKSQRLKRVASSGSR